MAYLVHRPFSSRGRKFRCSDDPAQLDCEDARSNFGNDFQRKLPIRMLLGFAAFSYLLIVGLSLTGSALHLPPTIVYTVCPACALTITVDPSLSSVLLILAPVNAAVYGAIGATIASVLVAIRRPNSQRVRIAVRCRGVPTLWPTYREPRFHGTALRPTIAGAR
jgi:hypothetical protein